VPILNIGNQALQTLPSSSGTYNFSVVRDDIIREALLNLGILEESEVPTAQEVIDCARKLNMIVKTLAGNMDKAPGFKMWQRERGDLFLSTKQYAYDLGPKSADGWAGGVTGLRAPITFQSSSLTAAVALGGTVLTLSSLTAVNINDYIGILIGSDFFWTTISSMNVGLLQVTIPSPGLPAAAGKNAEVVNYTLKGERPVELLTSLLRDSNGTDTPMTRMTVEVYEALPTKTQPGNTQDPTAFYFEPRRSPTPHSRYYIDCAGAQDVTKYQHIVYLREAQNFDNPGDAPEFPQEWFGHLCWTLSLMSHSMFDVEWTATMQQAFLQATVPAREANASTTSAYFLPEGEDDM
jgi:hypothetical protein